LDFFLTFVFFNSFFQRIFVPLYLFIMMVELLLIPLLFVSFAGWGVWAKMLIGNKTESFSLTLLLGFSFFGISTCLLSFFTPLNPDVELSLLIISIIPFFFKNLRVCIVRFPKEILKSVWFWIFCLIIVSAGSLYPFRPDHFSYYVPTLNWLNQFGLITGVADIDWNLGQMSVFHIMQAGLDQTIDPFRRLGVFMTVVFLIYLFERKSWLLLFAVPFYFLFIQTPSPDVAIVFLSLITVNELCFNYKVDNYKILLLISVFVFTIKPVAFWLPFWVFIAGLYRNKKKLKDFRIYLIPALLIIIYLIKNMIASSTLFYPVTFTKLNTYWLPDLRILELSGQKADMFTFKYQFTEAEINAMSLFQKIYYWLTINKLQTIINCLTVIIIIAFGIFSFSKKNFLYRSLWVIIVIKSAVVFGFSGQYRFMLDGMYPLLLIMLYPVRIGKTKISAAGLSFFLLFLILIGYPPLLKRSIPKFKLTTWMTGFTKESLIIPGQTDIKNYGTAKMGNLNFNFTPLLYNFDTPPPAFTYRTLKFYYDLGVFPQMKDSCDIRKGFYMKTLDSEEKENLWKIIETCFMLPHK